jgi:hypothetical protein
MPIKHAIWRVGSTPAVLRTCTLLNEQQLDAGGILVGTDALRI